MDPIADMLSKIRNAQAVNKKTVSFPYSKIKHEIAKLLVKEKYVTSVDTIGKKTRKAINVTLSYTDEGSPKIAGAYRVSKVSGRVYRGVREIFPVKYGYGIAVITTPKGIMTDKQARREKIGGEILFNMW